MDKKTLKTRKTWREKLEGKYPSHGKIMKILIPKPLDVKNFEKYLIKM